MSIVKAQKKIHLIKGEISELTDRIEESISTNVKNEYKEDYSELIAELTSKKQFLVTLKNAVMQKNIECNMFNKILELGENKAWLQFYKGLNIREGEVQSPRWSDDGSSTYKSQLTESERQDEIKKLKVVIEDLTDTLDEFNASHFIEVM